MNFEELQTLVAIEESGSQAAAARTLGLSRATLRRRLAQLEERIGVPLARTGPQGVELTHEARGIARQARRVVDEANALLKFAKEITGNSDSLLRIAVPIGFPAAISAQVMATFRELQPGLRCEVKVCPNPLEEIEHGIDLVVHFGAVVPPGPWESFPIMVVREYAAASPAYLEANGVPQSLDDLRDHTLLSWSGVDGDPNAWDLADGESLRVLPTVICNEMPILLEAARAGLGIAVLPEPMLAHERDPDASLVKVLPELIRCDRMISVVAHESSLDLPRIQFVLELLRDLPSNPALVELIEASGSEPFGEPTA